MSGGDAGRKSRASRKVACEASTPHAEAALKPETKAVLLDGMLLPIAATAPASKHRCAKGLAAGKETQQQLHGGSK